MLKKRESCIGGEGSIIIRGVLFCVKQARARQEEIPNLKNDFTLLTPLPGSHLLAKYL